MYSDILKFVRTMDDKEALQDEILKLRDALYITHEGAVEEVLDKNVRLSVGEILKSHLSDGASKEEYLKGLYEAINNIKILEITLAIELTSKILKIIESWIEQNISEDIILDIKIDPSLVAGAQIAFDGKFEDFSYGKKLIDSLNQYEFKS